MIPLEGCLHWRHTAPFHLQLELDQQHIPRVPGFSNVRRRVVRVFRTDGRLSVGDQITFGEIWVYGSGDDLATGPMCMLVDEFNDARYMEVYLSGNPPVLHLAAYELRVIAAPTDRPTLTPEQLEQLIEERSRGQQQVDPAQSGQPAGRWWQFWRSRLQASMRR